MGRGSSYSPARGAIEALLRVAYAGDWPARLWSSFPGACDVDRVDLTLPADVPALRVAFASDLHVGPTTPARTLDRAFERLREARPDVLALGGDHVFLDATPARVQRLEALVASVPARVKVAVLGNHDLWADHRAIERALERAGVRILVNDAVRLPPPHDEVAILGLDDPWTGRPDGDAALRASGDARLKLAIAHAPEAIPHVARDGVSLLLCGHTHGGQIALPGPRPIVVPGPLGRRHPFGRHRVGSTTVVVSRGVGGVELPVRWNAPPDVVIVTVGRT